MSDAGSEFEIIDRYFNRPASGAVLGIGDDAALITAPPQTELAVSTDTLVCDTHFFADADPYQLGYKALAVNLSDMAAMGAKPRWVLLALTLPDHLAKHHSTWLTEFSRGFYALAVEHDVALIGGDTTSGPLNIGVHMIGEVPAGKALRRGGAQVGDDIWISGQLGDAALALHHELHQMTLAPDEIAQCLPALLTPVARIALGQRLCGLAHSAIDISDGLLADLGHVLKASGKSACIAMADIPCSPVLKKYLPHSIAMNCLLAGGDDYELCFTASKIKRDRIEQLADELEVPLTRIGEVQEGDGLIIKGIDGSAMTWEARGYDHFSA